MKKYIITLITLAATLLSFTGTASAAILFQDDTFNDVMSDAVRIGSNDAGTVNTAIQFGNDSTASENGNITWNIGTNSFSVDHTVDITGGLSASGNVNFSSSTQTRARESTNPTTLAACANKDEIIVNTTLNRIEICTVPGAAGAATWITMPAGDASTLGGLTASQFLRSDTNTSYTSGTLTTNAGTTVDVNGVFDASGATRFALPSGNPNPLACTIGDVFYNTNNSILYVCTAANTWTAAGPQDFESVYAKDADQTLTTSGGNFTISSGAGNVGITNTTGKTTITSAAAAADAIKLDAGGAASGITGSWGTGGLNFSSATGAFSISGGANSSISTTGISDITLTSGDDIYFDDAQLTAAIQLTDTAAGIAAAFGTNGLIDALNSLTATTAGDGASNVGIQAGSLTNVTPATNDVQAALVALDAKVGAGAPNVDTLKFNVEYPDTVIYRDGSSNQGTLVSEYDNANNEQYYGWTTNNALMQDIELRFRSPLPTDFTSVGNFTGRFRTGTANAADNKVDFSVTNATDLTGGLPTTCGSSLGNVNTSWFNTSITAATINTGCTGATALNAGDIIQYIVKLYDINDGTAPGSFANAGWVSLDYNN